MSGPSPHTLADGVALAVPRLHLVVGEHAEGRDDVLGEVLVLVVAPDDHHVGAELVEDLARAPEVRDETGAVHGGGRRAAVVPVLAAHGRGPVRRVAVALGQARVAQHRAQDGRPCSGPDR